MSIKLKGSSDGSVSFDAPADTSPSGSDITLTLPTSAGSANQFVKNSGTAGTLEYSSMVETSTGLGIGTSSPVKQLQVGAHGSSSEGTIALASTTSGTCSILMGDGSTGSDFYRGYVQYSNANDAMLFATSASERMRLDSSGRFLFNTTSNQGGHLFQIKDGDVSLTKATSAAGGNDVNMLRFRVHNSANTAQDATLGGISAETASSWGGRLTFHTKPANGSPNETVTERMRINQKGFVKAGPRITDGSHGVADLNSARHEFTSDDNGWTIIVTHTSGAASEHEGILIDYNLDPNGSGNSFLQGNAGGNTRFRVASNGGLYNYQSNNSNLSDEREKKNIVNLDTKWDKVKSWDIKKFHYNEDADDDDLRYGVIAQQVEQHCPEVLAEWIKQSAKDAVLDEDGNVVTPAVAEVTRKGVKEQQMMWMAIKALQEAQTRIETLETQHADLLARVAALEAA